MPAVISSKDRPCGQPDVDAIEDGRGREVGQAAGRALSGGGTSGGVTHTPPTSRAPGDPAAALTVRISLSADRTHHPALGDAAALGGQRHLRSRTEWVGA